MSAIIELSDVRAGYGSLAVLHDVDFTVAEGSVVAVLGPNGAGKTTMLRVISGFAKPWAGTVTFDGRRQKPGSVEALAEAGLAYVPEGRSGLFPSLTVRETLTLAARSTSRSTPEDRADPWSTVERLFPKLLDRRRQTVSSLSGGEQQMLAICAVLLRRPRVLILDEPSLGLAPVIVDQLYAALEDLRRDGMTLVIVEEKAETVLRLADRVYVVHNGSIAHSGSPASLAEVGGLGEIVFGHG